MSGIPAGAGQLLGKRLGKFEILALLALGGTAEIYLARIGGAAGFEKYVVVKCLHDHLADDAEFVKMFLDEARLAAHLDHSNIVQTMELGQHDGRYYMVMEFLAGLSLAMIVRRAAERLPSARIPVPLVLNILAQSCAGLHYAHEKAMNGRGLNIVHRDISPQNLVVSFEGVVKLVDFGIAKAELRETHTRSGTIKGKFAYMSPEQCVANNVDRRTDVFALGVIAHELLTGQRLFKRPSPYETYQAVIQCEVTPPSQIEHEIDPALDPVILRALTKDRDARYPTAEAFGDALLGYLHHRGIGSGPGDVSRFFDGYFAQELEEHSARMRELISGRDVSVDTGVSWGDDGEIEVDAEPEGDKQAGLGELSLSGLSGLSGVSSLTGVTGETGVPPSSPDLGKPASPMSVLLDELGAGSRVGDDDEMPAERTRIESNPLERINELERLAAATPPPPRKRASSRAVSVSAEPARKSSPAVPLPGMPPPGRFPDSANVPTMIAPQEPSEPAAASPFANAPTTLDVQPLEPPAASMFADRPTAIAAAQPAPPGSSGHPSPGNGNGSAPWNRPQTPRPHTSSSTPPVHPIPSAPPGYPVMNTQLSEQIASGATVFPSASRGAQAAPQHPVARIAEASGPNEGYPPVRPPDSGPMPPFHAAPPGSGPFPPFPPGPPERAAGAPDPQRAASMMSPVGQNYPAVDWNAAAASRAKAVPPWQLAVLFVGALGVALALTILIAKLVS